MTDRYSTTSATRASLAARVAVLPFASDTGHRRFDLDTSDDTIDLAPGAYEAFNGGTVAAYARIGAATSIPADKAAEEAGQFVIPAGASVTFIHDDSGDGTLHAKTASGATTLDLHRKPL